MHSHSCTGEPDSPVSAIARNRPALTTSSAILGACDHDFTKFDLTPSVYLLCDIPDDSLGSFYRGQPVFILKDSVFQPSSPFRHMAEMGRIIKDVRGQDDVPPVMFLYHDGGPDHRLVYYSVMISYICVFKWLNLDFLAAVQTAPYNSWMNPCERLMSILNLALQGVSTKRQECAPDMQSALSSCESMAEIRKAAESRPGLQTAVQECLKPMITEIEARFSRLQLKDTCFKKGEVASNDQVECLWSFASAIDSQLSIEKTTKKEIMKAKSFLEFVDKHCRQRHYSFQIRKCSDPLCCSPLRCPQTVFDSLHWLPDLMLDKDKAHYKVFQDVFGKTTSEADRPSIAQSKQREEHPSSNYTAAKVRSTVKCLACDKPRCVYSEKMSTYKENKSIVTLAAEVNFYVCGSPLIPDSHPLAKDVYVRTSLSCDSPIERAYYSSSKTMKFPAICAHCGNKDCAIPQHLSEKFKVVLPICDLCTSKKLAPITYTPIRAGTKRKHPDQN